MFLFILLIERINNIYEGWLSSNFIILQWRLVQTEPFLRSYLVYTKIFSKQMLASTSAY
jgi:hypothetical protein